MIACLIKFARRQAFDQTFRSEAIERFETYRGREDSSRVCLNSHFQNSFLYSDFFFVQTKSLRGLQWCGDSVQCNRYNLMTTQEEAVGSHNPYCSLQQRIAEVVSSTLRCLFMALVSNFSAVPIHITCTCLVLKDDQFTMV